VGAPSKKELIGWTTESAWLDKDYPCPGGAIEMLGAFTQKEGFWLPQERAIKIRITIEVIEPHTKESI